LCGVLEQCKKGPDRDIFGRAARDLAIALQQVIAESGGTFEGLEPVWQALLQAAAELLVRSGASVTSGPVVGAVQAVPLLSADSYSTLLRRQLSGEPQAPLVPQDPAMISLMSVMQPSMACLPPAPHDGSGIVRL
jgi:hypothetical protein